MTSSTYLLAAEAGMPQLDPTFWVSQAFWLVLIFTSLYFILSRLLEYGDPLRWAITSIESKSDTKNQIISVEAVMIMNQDEGECVSTN